MSEYSPTARREFIGQLAIGAAAIAASACAPAALALPGTAPAPKAAPQKFDDSWVKRITGKHKAVFDAPEVADGTIVSNAWVYLDGFKKVYDTTDADMCLVLVMRHGGIRLAFDDYVWEKYDIGKKEKVKDDATGKWARRNPFWKPEPGKGPSPFTLEAIANRGAILIGCNLAARGFAAELAAKGKEPRTEAVADILAHLIPGVTLAPNGVFAVMRAQEVGCTYIRST